MCGSAKAWYIWVAISRALARYYSKSTFENRSNVSFSCRCFPVLLARSIHFPLNHLIVGLRRRSLASTFAMKVTSPPLETKNTVVKKMSHNCPIDESYHTICWTWMLGVLSALPLIQCSFEMAPQKIQPPLFNAGFSWCAIDTKVG